MRSGEAHCEQEQADEVRRGPLRAELAEDVRRGEEEGGGRRRGGRRHHFLKSNNLHLAGGDLLGFVLMAIEVVKEGVEERFAREGRSGQAQVERGQEAS